MIEQKYGPKRCRDTRKPRADQCPEVVFYRCRSCNSLFPVTGGQALEEKKIFCCSEEAERLVPTDAGEAKEFLELSYQITGGYNDNAVRVSWKTKKQDCVPEWIYLKTFTGGYLKYVRKEKRSPMVFALQIRMRSATAMKIPVWNACSAVRGALRFTHILRGPDYWKCRWTE